MMCSIMMTATPRAFSASRISRISSTSELESPAIASSETSSFGLAASARASSSLRMSTCVRPPESASARSLRPISSSTSMASASILRRSVRPRAAYSSGTRRFSSTVMLRKGFGIWKLRATPSAARWCGRRRVMSCPSKTIDPVSLYSAPEMQLMSVVLPEPFGPIRPRRSFAPSSSSMPSSATKPPKRLETPLTLRIGALIASSASSTSAPGRRCPAARA